MNQYFETLRKYATMSGRASRRELWTFVLVNLVVSLALRLHDIGKSGWYLLVVCIPFVGLILLYWYVLDGDPGDNAYGPNPKTARSA